MAEIFGYPIMGGGGSSGGTLIVTGVAGSTVTVSNADKSYTRTLDSAGKAIFKGLASGTWTVTMTNGSQTATRSVEITADYSVSIAYFAATINVTYPVGSTCTAMNGTTTLTAPDTSGTWACIVPSAGTWTVSCSDGTKTATATVSITEAGQAETVALAYELRMYTTGTKNVAWYSFHGGSQSAKAPTWGASYVSIRADLQTDTNGIRTDKLDLSAYKTLKLHIVSGDAGSGCATFGVTSTAPNGSTSSTGLPANAVAYQYLKKYGGWTSTPDKVWSLDISSITEGYVYFVVATDAAVSIRLDASEIWAE